MDDDARERPFRAAVEARGLPLHVFAWTKQAAAVRLARDAPYLVRPDGYVGLADPHADPATFEVYLGTWGLRPRAGVNAPSSP